MNVNGIGLGLMIAKQIVEQFEGTINFTSEKDKGTCFTFRFKLLETHGRSSELQSKSDISDDASEECQIKRMKKISEIDMQVLDSYRDDDIYMNAAKKRSMTLLEEVLGLTKEVP